MLKVEALTTSILNQKEVVKLLNPVIEDESFNFIRDRAVVALILSSAIYAHELCSLSENSINLKKHQLTVVNMQEEVRVIPLDKSLYYEPLKTWLDVRRAYLNNQKQHFLFFSTRGNPFNQRTLHRVIAQHFEYVGIAKIQQGSEVLRQTAIVKKLADGVPVKQVKAIVGLKSMLTIERHLELVKQYL